MDKSIPQHIKINEQDCLLSQIIETQSLLSEAHFNLDAFMQLVVTKMQLLTPASGVVVELVEGEEMIYRAATGTVAAHLGLRLNINQSISGLCIKTNKVLRCDDTEIDPRVNVEACRRVQARSMLVAPLAYEGNTVGVLKVVSKEPHKFTEKDTQTLQLMAGFIASGLTHQIYYEKNEKLLKEKELAFNELKNAKDRLEELAHIDYLTNLPNRRFFTDQLHFSLSKAKNLQSILAIIYLDIDHFKHINDTLGHDVGDELLKAFSQRVKHCIRSVDTMARLGGDEFIILLENIPDAEEAVKTANRIIIRMKDKFNIKAQSLTITTSLGITYYRGDDISVEELVKQADQALYVAKEAGRNAFHIYDN